MAAVEKVQSYANHRRIPPVYFQIAFVVLTGELIYRIIHVVRHPGLVAAWEVVVWFAVLVIAYAARRNAQIVQDRVIRHEMRMRLERLLGAGHAAEIARISLPQLVALRFASDEQLPGLVAEVSAGSLVAPDQIKQKIVSWQADWLRV
jgi:hypothetical protein